MGSLSSLSWFVISTLLSAIFLVALVGPARRFDLVDHPAGRKNHSAPTPLVGGLAIFLSLILTHLLAGNLFSISNSLLIAMLATVAIGVADDAHEIGHRSKFFAQLIAALLIVSGTEVHVSHLGDIFSLGNVVLDKWSLLVTVIAIIGLMNAINMIDGLDGLAGTQALVPILMFLGVAHKAGDGFSTSQLMILAGAISGFLLFNLRSPWRKRALVFMGDTGGLLLGLLLAWYSIRLAGSDSSPLRPITAVWILAVPLLDMGSVMFLRMIQKKSPFAADRQHLHYILVDAGFSVSQVVWTMAFVSIALAFVALLAEAHDVPEAAMFVGFVVLLLGYLALLKNPEIVTKLSGRPLGSSVNAPDSGG
jgi:UDP-GlcNAc:undecaprenyl-phosphate/decaprenyl-phosphate GlcNAc-1-phosphate transferase